jgi:hypothetical protein
MGRILLVLVFGLGFVYGNSYTVGSTADAGAGTLRQAIADANGHAGPDTITFSVSGRINLSTALPVITDTVLIDASSQFTIIPGDTVNGGNLITVGLELNGGGPNKGNHCVLRGLFIENFTEKAVYINQSNNNTIGGSVSGQKNVIANNRDVGIYISSSNNNQLIGNSIGTGADGSSILANTTGVVLTASPDNKIGGSAAGERNIIAGNSDDGIRITDITSTDNIIKGNSIGTNKFGSVDLGNGHYGVHLVSGARHTQIGGSGTLEGNYIAFNQKGVVVEGDNSDYNKISRNAIFDNDNLGIDLGDDGPGIKVVSGTPNEGISFPVITLAEPDTVRGTAPSNSIVEVFKADPDPLGFGEGKDFAGSGSATSGGNFAIAVSGLVPGDTATATATDGQSNTSEFSRTKRVDRYQPDNWLATKITPPDDYVGNDTINIDGKGQTKSVKIIPNDSTLYYIKIQNDGSTTDSFQVKGTGSNGNWTVSYYDSTQAGNNITAALTGSGWLTKPLAPTAFKEIRLVVKAGAVTPPDTLKEVLVTSASTVDTTKRDAVKALTAIKIAEPDNQIATKLDGSDYLGDGIYNTDGSQQTQSLPATSASAATYYIKIENDGNSKDVFTVRGDSGDADWQVAYYSDKTGSNDITTAVTTGTHKTDSLDTGAATEIRVEVKPQTEVPSTTTWNILVLSVSTIDTTKMDAVKATTTATAVSENTVRPSSYALLPIKPNPAYRTADIHFTLPVPASVTVTVFDVTGRTVRRLADRIRLNPGAYRLEWNGKDNFDTLVPHGVYFVELKTKSYQETKKLILVQ